MLPLLSYGIARMPWEDKISYAAHMATLYVVSYPDPPLVEGGSGDETTYNVATSYNTNSPIPAVFCIYLL